MLSYPAAYQIQCVPLSRDHLTYLVNVSVTALGDQVLFLDLKGVKGEGPLGRLDNTQGLLEPAPHI